MNRRNLLKAGTTALLAPWKLLASSNFDGRNSTETLEAFPWGVASGDPSSTGVILWTKLSPELVPLGDDLDFVVSRDKNFQDIVLSGSIDNQDISEENDFTVRVDLDGQLASHQQYFYRFVFGDNASMVGRCRTLPDSNYDLDQLSLAIVNCQDYRNGFYHAYEAISQDNSIDFVLHLGDFIYEKTETDMDHNSFLRDLTLPSGKGLAQDLEDYRSLYKTYLSDPQLMKARAQFTWMTIWDDHESINNAYWDYGNDTMASTDEGFAGKEGLKSLKLASQKAWFENIPARVEINPDSQHPHDYLSIYRSFAFGTLLNLSLSDTRTYRTKPSDSDSFQGSMLGESQKEWLLEQLQDDSFTWNVWGNQTLFSENSIKWKDHVLTRPNKDSWDGYAEERLDLIDRLSHRDQRNLVVLTGDYHATIAGDIKTEDDRLLGYEFLSPAISSASMLNLMKSKFDRLGPIPISKALLSVVKACNPNLKFVDPEQHGFGKVVFTKSLVHFAAFHVNKDLPYWDGEITKIWERVESNTAHKV